jgi:hypothetical protein
MASAPIRWRPEPKAWSTPRVKSVDNKGTFNSEDPDMMRERNSEYVVNPAKTSLNQVAALFKNKVFIPSGNNADIGGGKFDLGTNYLKDTYGIESKVFDTFSRDYKHNEEALNYLIDKNIPTTTATNVLNVVQDIKDREGIIAQAASMVDKDGTSYFSIYEGQLTPEEKAAGINFAMSLDENGISPMGKIMGSGAERTWQNRAKPSAYIPEIEKYFNEVTVKGNNIIAKEPKKDMLTKDILNHQGEQHLTDNGVVFDGSAGQHDLWSWYKDHEKSLNNALNTDVL